MKVPENPKTLTPSRVAVRSHCRECIGTSSRKAREFCGGSRVHNYNHECGLPGDCLGKWAYAGVGVFQILGEADGKAQCYRKVVADFIREHRYEQQP